LTDLSVLQIILANLALLAGSCLQGVAGFAALVRGLMAL